MKSVEKEERSDAMVEVLGLASEEIEFIGFSKKLLQSEVFASCCKGRVASRGIGASDEVCEHGREKNFWF